MDLCGFPKDNYYYYKSWWSDQAVLHLFPHWNWPGREGDEIDVRCFTNCDEVELFPERIAASDASPCSRNSHAAWKVKYEPGTLKALAFREGQLALDEAVETTGAADANPAHPRSFHPPCRR